jgi:N-methylhydantoinase A/oxoprolinase/acetone carboxylase beta subunit
MPISRWAGSIRRRLQAARCGSTRRLLKRRSLRRSASRSISKHRGHAAGVSEIVEENMTNAARVHAIERGKVISRYAIIAFGGGAPLHAGRLAEKLGVAKVVVPVGASVGSAIGFLRAPVAFEVVRSLRIALSRFDPAQVNALLEASATRAREVVRQAVAQGALTIRRSVDARYIGQGFDLTLGAARRDLEATDAQRLRAQFERLYQTVYGRDDARPGRRAGHLVGDRLEPDRSPRATPAGSRAALRPAAHSRRERL